MVYFGMGKKSTKAAKEKGALSALEKLKQQKMVIEARIQKAEAASKAKKRKQDKQRAFLVGEHYLNLAVRNGTLNELKTTMLGVLKRESDKVLFKEL
jgi:hypothetical protein